jgi:LemA protein
MFNLTYILIAVIAVLIIWLISLFNGLVTLKNRVAEAWSDIDVQLKRRYDLIPNLIETVKGYATHEKELLEKITLARSQAMQASSMEEKGQTENALSSTLKSLFAVSENYPDLKANENFAKLQDELSDTENKIQASRRFYNSNVRDFNTGIEKFPGNIFAGLMNFKVREFFTIDDEAQRQTPQVKF